LPRDVNSLFRLVQRFSFQNFSWEGQSIAYFECLIPIIIIPVTKLNNCSMQRYVQCVAIIIVAAVIFTGWMMCHCSSFGGGVGGRRCSSLSVSAVL